MPTMRRHRLIGPFLAAVWMIGCGGDGGGSRTATIDFHPPGGISERTHRENPNAYLHQLNNTAVVVLEATGSDDGDSGDEEGVDELRYHFEVPTDLTLSLGAFDEAPTMVLLDRDRREIARVGAGTGAVSITAEGSHTLRLEHPRRGNPDAPPIVIFIHPVARAAAALQGGGTAGVTGAELQASGTCESCDLSGLVWDGCSGVPPRVFVRATLDGVMDGDPVSFGFQNSIFDGAQLSCITFQPQSQSFPTRFNFAGATFDGATLSQVAFVRSDHDGGSFRGAVFEDTVFEESRAPAVDFTGASFAGATQVSLRDLQGAVLRDAVFDADTSVAGTLFNGADLATTQFLGTQFHCEEPACACFFDNECLPGFGCSDTDECIPAILGGDGNVGAVFDGVDLTGISFQGADLRRATFRNCVLDQTTFRAANVANARFPGTDLSRTDLSRSFGVADTDLSEAVLSAGGSGADLSCHADGTGVCASRNFRGYDLRYVKLNGAPLMQADLGGARLDFAQLRDVELAQATLDGASVSGTDLSGSDLRDASLREVVVEDSTNLGGANLVGADFTGADLSQADLSTSFVSVSVASARLSDAAAERGANLNCDRIAGTGLCDATGTALFKGSDLRFVQLNNVVLADADLEGVQFDSARLVGANLNFANLTGARFVGAQMGVAPGSAVATTSLRGALMVNVDLSNADLRGADLTGAHVYGFRNRALFVRAKLDSADLSGAILSEAAFQSASLTDAVFNLAQLTNASFDGANLTNAKFDDAYLQGADFSTAASINGMSLSNAAVSTTLTSTRCTLIPPGTWTYTEQDGTPYPFVFGETKLGATDSSVICPDNRPGPCSSADQLCPERNGPFPPIPQCTPVQHFCLLNCMDPPVFDQIFPNCL